MPEIRFDPAFTKTAKKLFKKHPDKKARVQKAIDRLAEDPTHRSLRSKKYSAAGEVWQSYVENNTPSAWRIWWQWSSDEPNTIVILGFGPHPK